MASNEYVITLKELYKHFYKWKKVIVSTAVTVFITTCIVSLFLPKYYLATGVIMPIQKSNNIPGLSMLRNLPVDIMPALGLDFGFNDDISTYIAILESRTLRLAMIDRFNLRNIYKMEKKRHFIELVLKRLDKNIRLYETDQGTIEVGVIDKSPERAKDMASFMIAKLDSINKSIIQRNVIEKRKYLEERLLTNRKELQAAEDSLVRFQKENKVISVVEQAEASIKAAAELETRLMNSELDLTFVKNKLNMDNAVVTEKASEIQILRRKLEQWANDNNGALLIPYFKIPDKVVAFDRVSRNVMVLTVLDKFLTKEFESVKLEEKNTVPTLSVLDEPMIPQKKFKPKRSLVVLITTFLITGVTIVLTFLLDFTATTTNKRELSM